MATHVAPAGRKYHSAESVREDGSNPVSPAVDQASDVGDSCTWTPEKDGPSPEAEGRPAASEPTTSSFIRPTASARPGRAALSASRSLSAPDTHTCSKGRELRGREGSPCR